MSKEDYKAINTFRVLSDWLAVVVSLLMAYMIHAYWLQGKSEHMGLACYYVSVVFYTPVYLLLSALFGSYDHDVFKSPQRYVDWLMPANVIGTLLLLAGLYLAQNDNIPCFAAAVFFVISTLLIMLSRRVLRVVLRVMISRGYGQKKVLLIGSNEAALRDYETMCQKSQGGIRITACLSDAPPDGLHCLGDIALLDSVLRRGGVDEVTAMLSMKETEMLGEIIDVCEKNGVKLTILPYFFQRIHSPMQIENYSGFPLISIRKVPLDNFANALLKRGLDIAISLLLLVLLAPLMLIAAIGTKLSCRGTVLFRQERVGKNNRIFVMYKFRSIHDKDSRAWVKKDGPEKSFFSSVLRKFSIDELPQLLNVLRGDMSLIGPRPELPHIVERFRECVPMYMVRHQIKPGMTGWAQINGLRGDTSIPERILHDLWYIENWSLLLDLRIFLLTPVRGFVGPEKIAWPIIIRKNDQRG